MAAVLDTHAVIWYLLDSNRLSRTALQMIEAAASSGDLMYVSAISVVETVYLVERGRIPVQALSLLLDESVHSILRVVPLDSAIAEAIQRVSRDTVPEMPDRIIAATAVHLDLPLITRDQGIRASGIKTIW
jgi:PIN domain nuclease of toxin-antitoxin system